MLAFQDMDQIQVLIMEDMKEVNWIQQDENVQIYEDLYNIHRDQLMLKIVMKCYVLLKVVLEQNIYQDG